jgi:hypothetical protein
MINHITSLGDGDFQSLHEMGPLRGSTPEDLKTQPDEDILTLLTVLSHDIRSSLLSMLATLKLLDREYYGKMDGEVAKKVKELLCHATHLSGVAEECFERTFAVFEGLKMGARSKSG